MSCNTSTGHVVKLDLHNDFFEDDYLSSGDDQVVHWLRGKISSSLLSLRHLKHLDLSGNLLGENMPIPMFVGSLNSLTYLDVSNMNFMGQLPPQLGNLTKLVYLNMNNFLFAFYAYSYSNSSDVSWLASLHTLEHLDMSGVNLSTAVDWVHALNTLPNLRVLYLCYCGLNSSSTSLQHHNHTVLEELDLSRNPFNSAVAPNWYWDVTTLKSLSISQCGFSGPFPDELGNMTLLDTLDMGWNNIEGMIPSTLKNLCSLEVVYLAQNNIGGDITDLIERLPNCSWSSLQKLYLFGANITGTTLKSVLNLTSLSLLFIHRNRLSGSVPVEIGTLKNLVWLHIGDNNLNGVISEDHFSGLKNLISIDLSRTYLHVMVKSDWKPPFDLDAAYLSSCHLGSHIPNWLQWQKSISYLDISEAGLVGRIPNWFWTTFSNAYHLDLSYNQFRGELPPSLEFMSVRELFLQSNHLTGSIPQLPRILVLLDISKNEINGELPSHFEAPYLQVAVLYSNRITGTIPYTICQWTQLRVLDLSNNLLSGELPICGREELKQQNPSSNNSSRVNYANSYSLEIRILLLNNNHLLGGFPLFLKKCQNLTFLDLSENRFSGDLPEWVSEDMPRLVMLRLRSNNFSGHIPVEITRLYSLHILDLANNSFSGVIPQSLVNLKALTTTAVGFSDLIDNPFSEARQNGYTIFEFNRYSNDSLSLVIKGQMLGYTKNAILFMSIDLSCNRLSGQIPEKIAGLLGVVNLNLSFNFLTGNIPDKIGNLQSLESLDLSNNKLSGEIPWRLSNLTSLAFLNLSYNNLSGRIPSGNQLDVLKIDDPASMYIGNPGLCGYPLPKVCPGDQPTQEDHINWHEDDKTQMDFHLGLTVGFIVGLWTIFCSLLFKKDWRYTYFSLLNKLFDKVWIFFVVTWQQWFRKPGTI